MTDVTMSVDTIYERYRSYKESISKEMNNDNNPNLHSMTNMSGWLRYCNRESQNNDNNKLIWLLSI